MGCSTNNSKVTHRVQHHMIGSNRWFYLLIELHLICIYRLLALTALPFVEQPQLHQIIFQPEQEISTSKPIQIYFHNQTNNILPVSNSDFFPVYRCRPSPFWLTRSRHGLPRRPASSRPSDSMFLFYRSLGTCTSWVNTETFKLPQLVQTI